MIFELNDKSLVRILSICWDTETALVYKQPRDSNKRKRCSVSLNDINADKTELKSFS